MMYWGGTFEFLGIMAVIAVASWIVFVIAGEKHESKAFVISFAMLMLGLGYMIFSGDGGSSGGQFDNLRPSRR